MTEDEEDVKYRELVRTAGGAIDCTRMRASRNELVYAFSMVAAVDWKSGRVGCRRQSHLWSSIAVVDAFLSWPEQVLLPENAVAPPANERTASNSRRLLSPNTQTSLPRKTKKNL